MKEKFKVIHSLKLMMFLVRNGFNVLKVEDAYPQKGEIKSPYKVFLFKDTPELKECCFKFSK
ncbi:MAG: DUF5659 domain-containing protein [Clostridia bacterium]|jgi:hypothetical protein|nr:DUF5659 domain-containing protein [Clostridia bacterium]